MTCEACKEASFMQKQLSIAEPPSTLLVHLKRFDYARQSKINTKVNFPIFGLNLAKYTSAQVPTSTAAKKCPKSETPDSFPSGLLLTGRKTGESIDHSMVLPMLNGVGGRKGQSPGIVLPSISRYHWVFDQV